MSSARRRVNEERLYYSPPAMRKHNQKKQEAKQKSSTSQSSSSTSSRRGIGSDSYLDMFLEHTTPVVPAQHFPRRSMRARENRGNEFHPYFILGDLWESFRERSVYGVGVPLLLDGSDSVDQYYVPSLSGIQLYIDPSKRVTEQRRPGEESDANSSRETSSDGESEYTTVRVANDARGCSRLPGRSNHLSDPVTDGDGINNPRNLLIFEFFEKELPFHREPLADKMLSLASSFPELKTYRSCDLAPSSWISIAWYPIYRIPVGPTLQNIDACFLTFHSLAEPERLSDDVSKLSLPSFGLVSYKFKVPELNGSGINELQKVNSLLRAAVNWLQALQVNHPDYEFFRSHNTCWT